VISQKALQEFIAIYKDEFGIELDETTALDVAINLLTFFDQVYRPVNHDWFDESK
jgi:hypothetical protein